MRRSIKRLHGEDARMLRDLILGMMSRIVELEFAVGDLQERINPPQDEKSTEVVA